MTDTIPTTDARMKLARERPIDGLNDYYVYIVVDSSSEGHIERVEVGFPTHDLAGPAFAGQVERPDAR